MHLFDSQTVEHVVPISATLVDLLLFLLVLLYILYLQPVWKIKVKQEIEIIVSNALKTVDV